MEIADKPDNVAGAEADLVVPARSGTTGYWLRLGGLAFWACLWFVMLFLFFITPSKGKNSGIQSGLMGVFAAPLVIGLMGFGRSGKTPTALRLNSRRMIVETMFERRTIAVEDVASVAPEAGKRFGAAAPDLVLKNAAGRELLALGAGFRPAVQIEPILQAWKNREYPEPPSFARLEPAFAVSRRELLPGWKGWAWVWTAFFGSALVLGVFRAAFFCALLAFPAAFESIADPPNGVDLATIFPGAFLVVVGHALAAWGSIGILRRRPGARRLARRGAGILVAASILILVGNVMGFWLVDTSGFDEMDRRMTFVPMTMNVLFRLMIVFVPICMIRMLGGDAARTALGD